MGKVDMTGVISTMAEQNWRDINFSSFDGLNIYARCYEATDHSDKTPVLCLPGLTRNSQDFHYIATYLSQKADHKRNVYCIDFRGRGRSDYDPDWKNYNAATELSDVLNLATVEGIHKASILGTSRGGIIAMFMASVRPTMIASCILNDIGPVIEREGLLRIRSYAGSIPTAKDWDEAAQIIRSLNVKHFPKLTNDDWKKIAHQLFLEAENRPIPSYDTDLAKPLSEIDFTQALMSMWPQFKALSKFPLMTIRGANSDILSEDTVEKMKEQAPSMEYVNLEDQGHAPFLNDLPIQETIYGFLEKQDASEKAAIH